MIDARVGHAAIYLGGQLIAHAFGNGFRLDTLTDGDTAWVYRSSNTELAQEVSRIAEKWTGENIEYSSKTALTSLLVDRNLKAKPTAKQLN